MTEEVSGDIIPENGTGGDLNAVNAGILEDNGATSGDVNNNKGKVNADMAVNGYENPDQQAGDPTQAENGIENINPIAEDASKDALRDESEDKDAEEIDQFDSVSNAISQQGKSDQKQAKRHEGTSHGDGTPTPAPAPGSKLQEQTPHRPKKIKKSVFVSYSPDAGFVERKFVVETIKQLKENNLAEDIWFDKDEDNTGSPCWFSLRMEAVEKCRAAILFLSDSYFLCPVSVYEGKTLLERTKANPLSVAIFPIMFSPVEKSEPPNEFIPMMKQAVNVTGELSKLSLAEKASVVIGTIMESLEKYACMNLPMQIKSPDTDFTGNYKNKKICQWESCDLQEWLFKLGIKEFYRQSLAENMVDGFLLMSLTDHDMINLLGIDSRVVRKKIMQNILLTLDKEHKMTDNWHLRARSQRAKPDVVYMIYDPADVRLAQNMKMDLRKKNLQVT